MFANKGDAMKNGSTRRGFYSGLVGGTLATLVLATTFAFAALPDSNEMLHACVDAGTGDVIIIDPSGSCDISDTPVTWPAEVRPGEGLKDTGGGATNEPLDVDFKIVQRRVNGMCPNGEAIRRIDDDGQVICEPTRPRSWSARDSRGGDVPDRGTGPILRLDLPAGAYFFVATLAAGTTRTGWEPDKFNVVRCSLERAGGASLNSGNFIVPPASRSHGTIAISAATVEVDSGLTIDLSCLDFGHESEYNDMTYGYATLTAIRLGASSVHVVS